ncbi:MAG: OmpA family protein [Deltaproteobacteria bacterium]|nr:OmpA family protein [Deltaproteobacteria bacterium]
MPRSHPFLPPLGMAATLGISTLAALPALSTPAHAETAIDAQIYKPALDPQGIFSIERARGLKKWDFGFRVSSNFATKPLKLPSLPADDDDDTVLKAALTIDFGLSMGLTDRLTFALNAPILYQQLGPGYGKDGIYRPVAAEEATPGTGFYSLRPDQNTEPSQTPTGDLRLGFKYQVTTGKFPIAVQAITYVPFGDEDVFAGSNGFTFEPKLIWELGLGSRTAIALNLGARLREGTMAGVAEVTGADKPLVLKDGEPVYVPLLYVGNEALVGVGGKFDVVPKVALGAEAYALIPIAKATEKECGKCQNGDLVFDALVGAFFQITPDSTFVIAGGAGVPGAARAEQFRAVAALSWAPTPEGARAAGRGDMDGDGIPDGPDVCRDEPEDSDGFQDDDGCPELDNDGDGVLDAQDQCPNEPEDRDGYDDNDGCPEGDNDKDNVADMADRCPGEREDFDGFQDDDGCPDEDNDGDGVLDTKDQCPNEPETVNGYLDVDGCPDQAVQGGPRMTADRVDLQGERVEFEGRTANLTKAAKNTLDAVADEMKKAESRSIRIRIEVGVERSGEAKKVRDADKRLTEQRARAVETYLMSKGIPVDRLDAVGLGSDRPMDPRNPKDPKLNRRVEFIRVTQ